MRPPYYPFLEETPILEVIEVRKWGISTFAPQPQKILGQYIQPILGQYIQPILGQYIQPILHVVHHIFEYGSMTQIWEHDANMGARRKAVCGGLASNRSPHLNFSRAFRTLEAYLRKEPTTFHIIVRWFLIQIA